MTQVGEPTTWRATVLAAGLTVFLLVLEHQLFGTPYRHYLGTAFDSGTMHGVLRLGALLATVGVQSLFFWTAFVASWPARAAYVSLFAVVTFIQYGYVAATGGFLTGHDFDIAIGAPMHWHAMATHYANPWTAVPVAAFVLLFACAGPPRRQGDRRRFLVLLVLCTALHALYAVPLSARAAGHPSIELGQPLVSSQGFARSVIQFAVGRGTRAYQRATGGGRQPVAFRASTTPNRHIVLVVDESVRGDHLSVNGYHRPTTPYLERLAQEGTLLNWGLAASTTPVSNDSILCLLTGVQTLPDRGRRTLSQPTMFEFAKAMGFETHWFDGGTRHLRFGFDSADLRHVDDWGTRDRFGDHPATDFQIAEAAARLLTRPTGQFIVIFKRGNHLPAEDNYPEAARIWSPDGNGVNGYDNALRYNIDHFFEILIGDAPSRDRTVVLYTSDHGVQLGAARPQAGRTIIWQDVTVPMLMLGGQLPAADTRYAAHHANIMPTILELMEVPAHVRTFVDGRSLLTARATANDTRLVFSGDFFGLGPSIVSNFDQLPR